MSVTTLDVQALFAAIDRRDADAFAAFTADDVVYRFSNFPPVEGREAVRDAAASFFAAIADVQHELLAVWGDGDTVVVELVITFTRTDGRQVVLPAVTVSRLRDGLLVDHRVFMNETPLFAE